MKRFCTLFCLICVFFGNLYAQYTMEEGLGRIPFSKLPYKERYLPVEYEGTCCVSFDSRIPARMYDDLQCKQFGMADEVTDFMPDVYLKIVLPDKSILGALSFGGATEYRTDMLFLRDLKGRIRDTLECRVMLDDSAIKQYELRESGEVIVYQMIFESNKLMLYEDYTVKPVPVIGHIHKTTYFIAPTRKFVKTKEEETDVKTFSSALLHEHNLWDETAFGMTYKK